MLLVVNFAAKIKHMKKSIYTGIVLILAACWCIIGLYSGRKVEEDSGPKQQPCIKKTFRQHLIKCVYRLL